MMLLLLVIVTSTTVEVSFEAFSFTTPAADFASSIAPATICMGNVKRVG